MFLKSIHAIHVGRFKKLKTIHKRTKLFHKNITRTLISHFIYFAKNLGVCRLSVDFH